MAEYITRDSALAFQCEVEPVMCESIVTGEVFSATPDAALVKFFNALPFADVREVVRGRWKQTGGKYSRHKTIDRRILSCSVCGNILYMEGVNAGRGDANFCPNCGADMREES